VGPFQTTGSRASARAGAAPKKGARISEGGGVNQKADPFGAEVPKKIGGEWVKKKPLILTEKNQERTQKDSTDGVRKNKRKD